MEATPCWRIKERWSTPRDSLEDFFRFKRWKTRYQELCVWVLRLCEDIPNAGNFYELAGVHHANSVCKLGHESHVVSDQNHGCTQSLLGLTQGAHYLALNNHIQSACWLIGDNNFWICQNSALQDELMLD
jgi:hypothetical protein